MPSTFLGTAMNILISGDLASTVAELQRIGYQPDSLLHAVASTVTAFAQEQTDEQEDRWELVVGMIPPGFFVCRALSLPRLHWLLVRRTRAGWILSGIVSEIPHRAAGNQNVEADWYA